jgi:hypothetical protein
MTTKTKIVSLEIPEDLRKLLKAEAYRRDLSLSACIRELLRERLLELTEINSEKTVTDIEITE